MKIKVIAPIHNLYLENVGAFWIEYFLITRSTTIVQDLFKNEDFVIQQGTSALDYIKHHYIFHYEGDSNDIPYLRSFTNEAEIARFLNAYFASLIHNLWFVKDTSAFVHMTYVQNLDTGQVTSNTIQTLMSNRFGLYNEINTFNLEDINFYFIVKIAIDELEEQAEEEDFDEATQIDFYSGTPNQANKKVYNGHRIKRAYKFLSMARSNSDLIIKITFYMSALECLMTSSKTSPISNKLARRAAAYIGGDRKTFLRNADFFRNIYDNIRSEFIHGNAFSTSPDSHAKQSEKLDNYIRIILRGVINKPAFFMLPETPESIANFEQQFEQLVIDVERGAV